MASSLVFLDESGHFANSDHVCMAGYMANGSGWDALCEQWRRLLREKYKIPAIHMREIMSPQGKSPASAWDIERKVEMLREFICAIREHTSVGFGVAIDAKHYRNVVKAIEDAAHDQKRKTKPFKVQLFCIARIVRLVMAYLEEIGASEDERKTGLVFDDDEVYSKTCYGLLCELKKRVPLIRQTIVSVSFADDVWYYPLQAADILAYAGCHELKKGEEGWKESNVFSDLLKDEDSAYGKTYRSEYWSDDKGDTTALMEAIMKETVQF
jgi:hypothetical protein